MTIWYYFLFLFLSTGLIWAQDSLDESASEMEEFQQELNQDVITNQAKVTNYSLSNIRKQITLKDIIEEGLRLNNAQRVRKFSLGLSEINWLDSYYDFWFPKIKLTVNSGNSLVEKLYTDNDQGFGTTQNPNGYFGLEIEEYSLFNWGRDYLDYLNQQATWERTKEQFTERKRRLRFDLIDGYFNLVRMNILIRTMKSQLRHTSFIYRLSKEKLELGKIKTSDFLQAKEEFLRSQSIYHETSTQLIESEQRLAELLGDEINTRYKPLEILKYKPLSLDATQAKEYANKLNPNLRDSRLVLDNSTRSFKKNLKDNLALPEIKLNMGAYRHNFDNTGVYDSFDTGAGRNVELTASINASWTLLGSGGLLNARDREKAYLNKRVAEIEFYETKRAINVRLSNIIRQIQFFERKYDATNLRLKNAQMTFDKILDQYISSKSRFPDLKIALDSLINSEIDFQNSKYFHLRYKLELAELLGLDDFPGESFERLVLE